MIGSNDHPDCGYSNDDDRACANCIERDRKKISELVAAAIDFRCEIGTALGGDDERPFVERIRELKTKLDRAVEMLENIKTNTGRNRTGVPNWELNWAARKGLGEL